MRNKDSREIFEDFVFHDFSLSEIAEVKSISRQGVSDMIRRCTKKLEDYESRLHLVDKFLTIKEDVSRIQELSAVFSATKDEALIVKIGELSNHILEEF